MPYFLLGLAILGILMLVVRWMAYAEPKDVVRALRIGAIAGGVVIVVAMALSGQLVWLMALAPALLPWLMRYRMFQRRAKAFRRMGEAMGQGSEDGFGTGQKSEVQTRYLRVVLDHDTGELDGEVIGGPYAGRLLSGMARHEIMDLARRCTDDPQSSQVLETYLDRVHEGWRDDTGPKAKAGGAMTREEALQILGLEEGADEGAIKAAYHRLMANVHPDRGGTSYLAAKINEAKDVLLGR